MILQKLYGVSQTLGIRRLGVFISLSTVIKPDRHQPLLPLLEEGRRGRHNSQEKHRAKSNTQLLGWSAPEGRLWWLKMTFRKKKKRRPSGNSKTPPPLRITDWCFWGEWGTPCGLQDLSLLSREQTQALAVRGLSASRWASRELPDLHFKKLGFALKHTQYFRHLLNLERLY